MTHRSYDESSNPFVDLRFSNQFFESLYWALLTTPRTPYDPSGPFVSVLNGLDISKIQTKSYDSLPTIHRLNSYITILVPKMKIFLSNLT